MRWCAAGCSLVTLVALVGYSTPIPAAKPSGEASPETIIEAVYRYQFDHNASGQKSAAGLYCLSLSLAGEKDKDPSPTLLRAFKDHTPPVKPVSQCEHSMGGVYDRETGKRGLIFYVTDVQIISDTEATASGGYYEGGLSSSGNSYHLTKVRGAWKVTADQMGWIS
jgi:hypothetical protein